jgi:hypothetical protein
MRRIRPAPQSPCRMKSTVSIKSFVASSVLILFLASYGDCIAKPAPSKCVSHTDQASCEEDACRWAAKKSQCKNAKAGKAPAKASPSSPIKAAPEPWKAETKIPFSDCSVHRSESYCENDTTNKCHWGTMSAQCLGPGRTDKRPTGVHKK